MPERATLGSGALSANRHRNLKYGHVGVLTAKVVAVISAVGTRRRKSVSALTAAIGGTGHPRNGAKAALDDPLDWSVR